MPDEDKPKDAPEESGAGYGNNTATDVVGEPGEDEETMPDAPED